jgi:hypothetical protein
MHIKGNRGISLLEVLWALFLLLLCGAGTLKLQQFSLGAFTRSKDTFYKNPSLSRSPLPDIKRCLDSSGALNLQRCTISHSEKTTSRLFLWRQ